MVTLPMSHLPYGPVYTPSPVDPLRRDVDVVVTLKHPSRNEHVRDSQGTTCTSCRGSIQAEVIADVLSAHDCSSLTAMQFRRVDYTEVSIQSEVIAAVLSAHDCSSLTAMQFTQGRLHRSHTNTNITE